MARAFVAVGSNIEPEKNVRAAILRLAGQARVIGISTVYRTGALGRPEQPCYFNCVVELETDMSPEQIRREILRPVESSLGRVRTWDKYAARTIDLDLIMYDDMVLETADMQLPDPDILVRPFLAIPLCELAPGLVLPGSNLHLNEIAAALSRDGMTPVEGYAVRLRNEVRRVGQRQSPK